MWFIVGLGNPGARYAQTRHNAGFLVVDRLCERWAIACDRKQHGALVGEGSVRGERVVVAKPQGFMNLSGQPVRSLLGFYKQGTDRLIVAHDEVDVPFGEVRIKRGGGHGGHNGLRDLGVHLPNVDYLRVRVGVGRPPEGWDTADYVLGAWAPNQRAELDGLIDRATDAVERVLDSGPDAAMNAFNTRATRKAAGTPSAEGLS